jgi:hypothetical protein
MLKGESMCNPMLRPILAGFVLFLLSGCGARTIEEIYSNIETILGLQFLALLFLIGLQQNHRPIIDALKSIQETLNRIEAAIKRNQK